MKDESEFYSFLEEISINRPEVLELTPPQLIELIIREKCVNDLTNLHQEIENSRDKLISTFVKVFQELEKSSHKKR